MPGINLTDDHPPGFILGLRFCINELVFAGAKCIYQDAFGIWPSGNWASGYENLAALDARYRPTWEPTITIAGSIDTPSENQR
jgi:hypothetical protein